jgi:aromatic ring-cleaving dioxygenase
LGVWDTVGALGLPEELTPLPKKAVQLFGFHDRFLGEHIEAAYQALALNEMRVDFVSTIVQFRKTIR